MYLTADPNSTFSPLLLHGERYLPIYAIYVNTDNIFSQLSLINSDLITTFDNPNFARIWPVMHLKILFTHLSGPTVGYICIPVISGDCRWYKAVSFPPYQFLTSHYKLIGSTLAEPISE